MNDAIMHGLDGFGIICFGLAFIALAIFGYRHDRSGRPRSWRAILNLPPEPRLRRRS